MKEQYWASLALSTLLALASGCQKAAPPEPPPAPPQAPAAAATPAAPAAATKPVSPPESPQAAAKPLEWDDPAVWKKVPPKSAMRKATYEVPAAKGDLEVGELNVFVLGGGVDANIKRWVDEFGGVPLTSVARTERTVNEMRQVVVEIPTGKFSGGMTDKGPRDNYGLLGAIVVAPSGAEYFFKLIGPSATVKAARSPFYALLDSIREQGGTAEQKPGATPGTKPTAKGVVAEPPSAKAPAAKP